MASPVIYLQVLDCKRGHWFIHTGRVGEGRKNTGNNTGGKKAEWTLAVMTPAWVQPNPRPTPGLSPWMKTRANNTGGEVWARESDSFHVRHTML